MATTENKPQVRQESTWETILHRGRDFLGILGIALAFAVPAWAGLSLGGAGVAHVFYDSARDKRQEGNRLAREAIKQAEKDKTK